MRLNDAAKVGLASLVAVGILVWITFALRGPLGQGGSYLQKVAFDDARGIQEGAPVRVRGVDVGQVREIHLGSRGKAEVTLRVSDEYKIRPDDLIQIVGGTLGFGQPYVDIQPAGRKEAAVPGPDNTLPGEAGPKTETVISRSEELLTNLNGLVKKLNGVTEGFQKTMNDPKIRTAFYHTAQNFDKMSTSGVVITRNLEHTTAGADKLIAGFRSTAADLDHTLHRADALMKSFNGTASQTEGLMRDTRAMVQDTRGVVNDTRGVVSEANTLVKNTNSVVTKSGELIGDFRGAVAENREKLKEIFDGLNGSLKRLDNTLASAQSFLNDDKLRGDLKETATNVRSASENLQKLTGDLHSVTSDPKVQEDLKSTLANLRDASSEAAETFRRVRGLLGGKGNPADKLKGTEIRTDLTRGIESNHTRLDLDATVPWTETSFYRVGFWNLGDNLKLNAQAGRRLAPNTWGRLGVHASSLGLGLDFGSPTRPLVGLDLFGVNHPRFDARGYIPIGRSFDVTVGLDNVIKNPDPVFGLRYRR